MKLVKNIARRIIFPSVTTIGLEKVFSKFSKNKLLNIYYHGVVENDSNYFSPRHMQKEQFDRQMKYFKANFDIITVKEAFEIKTNKTELKRPTITISFDDGYLNNLTTALPILNKYDINATFFISGIITNSFSNKFLWTDILAFAKYFCKESNIVLQGVEFVGFKEKLSQKSFKDFLKTQSPSYRDESIRQLIDLCNINARKSEVPEEIWKLLSKNNLVELSKNKNVEIGSHGYNHYNLGDIELKDAIIDIQKSKSSLEEAINKEIDMICYPDGSYNQEVLDACIDIGFKYNICCDYKGSSDSTNPNIINRYGISNTTTYSSNIFFINKNFKTKGL